MDDRTASMHRALSLGAEGAADDSAEIAEMRKNRRVNQRLASGGMSLATTRPRDPYFYWKQNNLPYDTKGEGLKQIRGFCRLLYQTHPIVASCVDIYSKYPISGMELRCKDEAITEFYSTLFFDELDYEDFLLDVGREYWSVGEAWPFGHWNELLGVWDKEELLNPDDIWVISSPFLREPRFEMRVPDPIRTILTQRQPVWEYEKILREWPEFANYLHEDARLPVSGTLLKQLRFKADTFNPRGVPILMRGFRTIMQEEMLNAAMDSVADRLYTPLILAKLGASATDLGTQDPWIPTPEDLQEFEANLDAALAADFRVMTHNFTVDMSVPLGREMLPRADDDFSRAEERTLQVFGLSKTMLSGASGGETYAADALNRDLISQLLTSYQRLIKRHFRERALVVAEAQEHFDFEERNGRRYVVTEEVLEVDPHSGEQRIVERPKLLVPELQIKAMNMQDDAAFRGLIEGLRAGGVPISMKSRLINVPVDLEEERETYMEEQVQLALDAQELRKKTYVALRDAGLPIPQDLINDFGALAQGAIATPASPPVPMAGLGLEDPYPAEVFAAPELALSEESPDAPSSDGSVAPVTLPRNRTRPPESDEQRARMPKPASRLAGPSHRRTPQFEIEERNEPRES